MISDYKDSYFSANERYRRPYFLGYVTNLAQNRPIVEQIRPIQDDFTLKIRRLYTIPISYLEIINNQLSC